MLGDGTASAQGPALIRGHAYKARLVFQAIEQEMKWKPTAPSNLRSERFILAGLPGDLTPLFQFAYDQGARIHSNSGVAAIPVPTIRSADSSTTSSGATRSSAS